MNKNEFDVEPYTPWNKWFWGAVAAVTVFFGLAMLTDAKADEEITLPKYSYSNLMLDPGGNVVERMVQFELLEESGAKVEISGICLSACTMYLGLPEVCVAPRTTLGFHSAADMLGDVSEFGNTIIRQYYPKRILEWVEEKKALETTIMTFMTAEEAWSLGVKKCGDNVQP